jgi:signal recognition particle receptor subunit beta
MTGDEVVVAVLGVTGAGKSSFVKRVSNHKDIYVEDGLTSGTLN